MFSKQFAASLKHIISSDAEKDLILLFDEYMKIEQNKLYYGASHTELVATLAKIELLKKLKEYKSVLEAAYKNG